MHGPDLMFDISSDFKKLFSRQRMPNYGPKIDQIVGRYGISYIIYDLDWFYNRFVLTNPLIYIE